VRQAFEFINATAYPVMALQFAAAVNVSQRSLEYGFRKCLGVTPGVYLRKYRMNRVYYELTLSDPAVGTVTKIALKWHFSHLGRFSVAYRGMFGESPSETLKKRRRLPQSLHKPIALD
jgi:transcriptional regulator GlxA family with amidase domain